MESSTELEHKVDVVVNTADVEISGSLTSARKAGFWKRTSRGRIRRS